MVVFNELNGKLKGKPAFFFGGGPLKKTHPNGSNSNRSFMQTSEAAFDFLSKSQLPREAGEGGHVQGSESMLAWAIRWGGCF